MEPNGEEIEITEPPFGVFEEIRRPTTMEELREQVSTSLAQLTDRWRVFIPQPTNWSTSNVQMVYVNFERYEDGIRWVHRYGLILLSEGILVNDRIGNNTYLTETVEEAAAFMVDLATRIEEEEG